MCVRERKRRRLCVAVGAAGGAVGSAGAAAAVANAHKTFSGPQSQ